MGNRKGHRELSPGQLTGGRIDRKVPVVFVDADACPVTGAAVGIASTRGIPVTLVGNTSQDMSRYGHREHVEIVEVPAGRDAADFAIVTRLSAGDIVVTGDTGLAGMALGKGAHALSPRGRVFDPHTIDMTLHIRHEEARIRRSGGRTKGPAPFTEEDRERFVRALKAMLGKSRPK